MKLLLAPLFFFGALLQMQGEEPSERLEVFHIQWALHMKTRKAQAEDPLPQHYPLIPNRISECVPGKLYDVRAYFEEHGVKFGDTGFAWYGPESSILVLRAPAADMQFIEHGALAVAYSPSVNLRINGEVIVQPPDGSEAAPSQRLRWEIYTYPGRRNSISAAGKGALSYSCEIEMTLDPSGNFVDYITELKVTLDGREYSITANATIGLAKQHSLLLGTTPTGDEVRFNLTPHMEQPRPASPLDDPAVKKRLLECIQGALHRK